MLMQPSTREGFGLVITEALWKGKAVIGADAGAIPLQIRHGDTGYFFRSPKRTAERVSHLLNSPSAAELVGGRGRSYVKEHFLMPDRIADYLMAMDMAINSVGKNMMPADSITSFHPWVKLSKRMD